MAQPITNDDLDKNKPQQNQGGQNQSAQNQTSNNQSQGNSQIAQNYSGQQPQQPATPAANPNQQKGSGYTNIQRIVGANQSNKLGQTIGNNIQQAGQKAQGNVNQAQQQFQQQSNANRADTSQNQQLIQQAMQDPTQVAGDQSQVNKFQNLLGGIYQGPQGLQNAGQLQAQAQDVNQLGQSIGSAEGRQGLLQRFVGNPQYNQGQQTMDSLLLGATGGKDLANARHATSGIAKQEQSAEQGASQTAQEYANRAKQLGQDVQNQFGQNVSQQQQGLVQQAQNAQQDRDSKVAALQQQVADGTMSQEVADKLGLGMQTIQNVAMGPGLFGTQGAHLEDGQGMYTYGVDPSKYISKNAQQATAQNAASAQQYAQMQALAKLGGQFAPQQAQQTLAQFNNPSQAGTYQAANAYNVDNPGFQQALQGGKDEYQNYVNSTLNPQIAAYNQGQGNANMQRAFASSTGTSYGGDPGPRYDLYWKLLAPYTQQLNQAKADAVSRLGKQYSIAPKPDDENQS